MFPDVRFTNQSSSSSPPPPSLCFCFRFIFFPVSQHSSHVAVRTWICRAPATPPQEAQTANPMGFRRRVFSLSSSDRGLWERRKEKRQAGGVKSGKEKKKRERRERKRSGRKGNSRTRKEDVTDRSRGQSGTYRYSYSSGYSLSELGIPVVFAYCRPLKCCCCCAATSLPVILSTLLQLQVRANQVSDQLNCKSRLL